MAREVVDVYRDRMRASLDQLVHAMIAPVDAEPAHPGAPGANASDLKLWQFVQQAYAGFRAPELCPGLSGFAAYSDPTCPPKTDTGMNSCCVRGTECQTALLPLATDNSAR